MNCPFSKPEHELEPALLDGFIRASHGAHCTDYVKQYIIGRDAV
jgi:hypothetical protein